MPPPPQRTHHITRKGSPVTLPGGATEPMIPDERPESIEAEFSDALSGETRGRMALFFALPTTAAKVGQIIEDADGARWQLHRRKGNRRSGAVLSYVFLASAGALGKGGPS